MEKQGLDRIVDNHGFAWLLCSICLIMPSGARACACSQAPPGACLGLQKGDVVFLGTVDDIDETVASPARAVAETTNQSASSENSNAEAQRSSAASTPGTPVTRYHFRIDEHFAGSEIGDIDVLSGGDDGDCGYRFKKGEQYVVFTGQEVGGHLFATMCNGTRPASEGRALLPQLRAMRNGQRVASVFGIIRRTDAPVSAPPDDPDEPPPNIALRLRSRDDRFSTSTGTGGTYTFYDVHAGEYSFTANPPVRMLLRQKELTGSLPPFKIPNGACYEYDVDVLPTGHIRGSVLGPDGKPIRIASVELYRAGQYSDTHPGLWSLWSFQGSSGFFDFDHIGPGDYIIAYNRMDGIDPNSPFPRSFYAGTSDGGEAKTIRLKDGQQVMKANIKLREGYPTRPLRVRVNWEHARQPGNVTVMAKSDDGTPNPAARAMGDGVFEFTLLKSRHYTVYAWEDLDLQHDVAVLGSAPCAIPARIDAGSVTVDASNAYSDEVMLTFPAIECAKE